MVSLKAAALAFAGAVQAVTFSEWCQHNGLVSSYNAFIKEDQNLVSMIEGQNPVTVFIPTDGAFSTWLKNGADSYTFAAQSQTFLYMAVTGSYTIDELQSQTSLSSLVTGQKLGVHTTGIVPSLEVVITSGTNMTHNSTAGVINDDFNIANGKVQLVDSVFQLPTALLTKANKNTSTQPSNAKRNVALAAAGIVTSAAAMLF